MVGAKTQIIWGKVGARLRQERLGQGWGKFGAWLGPDLNSLKNVVVPILNENEITHLLWADDLILLALD